MEEIEIERTFLVKALPSDLKDFPSKVLLDIYIPSTNRHPNLRIRQKGDTYEMTKKLRMDEHDRSEQKEMTIPLTEEEFAELTTIEGKRVKKIRYFYPYNGQIAEIGIFQDDLEGLVLADFEFKSTHEKEIFEIPDWCLIEVTQEEFLAGGMLCGKTYDDISPLLKKCNYSKIKDL